MRVWNDSVVQGSEHCIDGTGFVKSTIISILTNCLSNVSDWSRGVRCGDLRSKWKEKTCKHSIDQSFKCLSHRNFGPWLEEILKMDMEGNFVYVTGLEWRYMDEHQNTDRPYPLKVVLSMLCSPLCHQDSALCLRAVALIGPRRTFSPCDTEK